HPLYRFTWKRLMNDKNYLDFLSALGEEFCETLTPILGFGSIIPQDAFEVFIRAFDTAPQPLFLAALSEFQLEQLRVACEQYFEHRGIPIDHLRQAIGRTL